ncbi:MAG: hypothetical protein ACFFEK_14085 [Candidatus Thorarchaeota archaeon]
MFQTIARLEGLMEREPSHETSLDIEKQLVKETKSKDYATNEQCGQLIQKGVELIHLGYSGVRTPTADLIAQIVDRRNKGKFEFPMPSQMMPNRHLGLVLVIYGGVAKKIMEPDEELLYGDYGSCHFMFFTKHKSAKDEFLAGLASGGTGGTGRTGGIYVTNKRMFIVGPRFTPQGTLTISQMILYEDDQSYLAGMDVFDFDNRGSVKLDFGRFLKGLHIGFNNIRYLESRALSIGSGGSALPWIPSVKTYTKVREKTTMHQGEMRASIYLTEIKKQKKDFLKTRYDSLEKSVWGGRVGI